MSNVVKIPYTPREAFLPYHESKHRFSLTIAHRRAGKTVARINKLIKCAVTETKLNPRFAYITPFFVQAKDIAWAYIKHFTAPIPGMKYNESELSATFPHNNAVIRLYGAENAERMRGLYFDGVVADEAQGILKSVLSTVILPALADRQGWLDVSGTPRGWQNLLGELFKMAKNDPDWFCQVLKASDTNIIPKDELKRQRQLMSDNEYEQEFECSFDAAVTGAVYGKQIARAIVEGRVKPGVYDPDHKVNTAWDLGFDDATSMWFWQQIGNETRLIDYYENAGHGIEHYVGVLKDKPYRYGKHYVPHDAANKLLAAGGRSIVMQASALGVEMDVVPATSMMNNIEAARKLLETCWFDEEKTKAGLHCLMEYHFPWDEERQTYRDKPLHNFASHAADAFEIIGQVARNQVKLSEPEKKKHLTFNDVMWNSIPKANEYNRI